LQSERLCDLKAKTATSSRDDGKGASALS